MTDQDSAFEPDANSKTSPKAAPKNTLRKRVARAIHRYDNHHALSGNDIPSKHHYGEADFVLAELRSELDALDALRAVARGYCPDCGRGDAAPTVEDWEQQRQRAEDAEGRLAHLQATSEAAGILLTRTTDERDQLRAATARVRALAARIRQGAPWTANHDDLTDRILAALEPVGPATTQTTEPAGWLHAGTRDLSIPNPPSEDTP